MELPVHHGLMERGVLYFLIFSVFVVFEEAVVNYSKNFIHTLNILNTWIQFCVNKQDSMKNISMCLNIIFCIVGFVICLFHISLSF